MTTADVDVTRTALLIVDLQNDFIHPEGAYARGGAASAAIAALPRRIAPLAQLLRAQGGLVISTHFTLVPGREGEPIVSPHLRQLRPFLQRGDFRPGSWGHDIVEELKPVDCQVEKIAYSAFYQTRLEWMLRKLALDNLLICGIVTNGGVASTVRDAHVRDLNTTVLHDGCAAFDPELHRISIDALRSVAHIVSIEDAAASITMRQSHSRPAKHVR